MSRGAGARARRQERREAGIPKAEYFSPTAKAREEYTHAKGPDARLARGLGHGVSSRPAHVCVGKMFAFHPDAKLRELAYAQASESHEAHGYCKRPKGSMPLSLFQKNDHTGRIALGMKRAQRIKERGW